MKYSILPIGLMTKDGTVKPHGSTVEESELTDSVEKLIAEGFICPEKDFKKLTGQKEAEETATTKSKKDQKNTLKEAEEAAEKNKENAAAKEARKHLEARYLAVTGQTALDEDSNDQLEIAISDFENVAKELDAKKADYLALDPEYVFEDGVSLADVQALIDGFKAPEESNDDGTDGTDGTDNKNEGDGTQLKIVDEKTPNPMDLLKGRTK